MVIGEGVKGGYGHVLNGHILKEQNKISFWVSTVQFTNINRNIKTSYFSVTNLECRNMPLYLNPMCWIVTILLVLVVLCTAGFLKYMITRKQNIERNYKIEMFTIAVLNPTLEYPEPCC